MVIRMRHTRAHTKNRRSHHALKAPTLAVCKNCGANHRPHHMCLECGFYNGRQVIDLAKKKEERQARLQKKQEMRDAEAAEAAAMTEPEVPATNPESETKEEDKKEDAKS